MGTFEEARAGDRRPSGARHGVSGADGQVVSLDDWRQQAEIRTRDVLAWAVGDPATIARYRAKLIEAPGSACLWWIGALSGAGHGRFSLGRVRGRTITVIAHRYGYALAHGVEALDEAGELAHGCDNPMCQRINSDHVRASTAAGNRAEYLARRSICGSPLADRRGALPRALAIRDALRTDPTTLGQILQAGQTGTQGTLW